MTQRLFPVPSAALRAAVFGAFDENVRRIESECDVQLFEEQNGILIQSESEDSIDRASSILSYLLDKATKNETPTAQNIAYAIDLVRDGQSDALEKLESADICLTSRGKRVRAKTVGQQTYVDAIEKNTVTIASGPAGTGKTFLAVAMAVCALRDKQVSRIILTRPAVEAGERLGFLPGDLQSKIDPYLRPLYDALFEMMGMEGYTRHAEKGEIEIAPLAYMRGRTLDDSFIILDEAQNTTSEQMKMFLTRLGFGSKIVVTGDPTQIDLPRGVKSGLIEAVNILQNIPDIAVVPLTDKDIVRHSLVQKIIRAYENNDSRKAVTTDKEPS